MGAPLLLMAAGLMALSKTSSAPETRPRESTLSLRLYCKGSRMGEVEVYPVGEELYAPAEDLARWCGAGLTYYPASQEILLSKKGRTLSLRLYDDRGSLDGEALSVPAPLLREGRPVVDLRSSLRALEVYFCDGRRQGFLAIGKRKREKGCGRPRMFSLGSHRFYLEVPKTLSPLRFCEEEGCLRLYDEDVAVAEFGSCECCGLGEYLVDENHEGFFCRICCPHHPAVENLRPLAMSYAPRTAALAP